MEEEPEEAAVADLKGTMYYSYSDEVGDRDGDGDER